MSSAVYTPRDLAALVFGKLSKAAGIPALPVLEEIFQILFLTSLQTEEATPITACVAYLDPRKPDPAPPPQIRMERWQFTALREPVQFTVQTLTKVALAADPEVAALVVFPKRNKISIVGIVDQQHTFNTFRRYESEDTYDPPGVFQARIMGLGHIIVSRKCEIIAELKGGTLIHETVDVFSNGPILKSLIPNAVRMTADLKSMMMGAGHSWNEDDDERVLDAFIQSLCRILVRAKSFGRGGTILLTPSDSGHGLSCKHSFRYSKLRDALHDEVYSAILEERAQEATSAVVDADKPIPADLYLDKIVYRARREDARSALQGAIALAASLTRVDGAVVMTGDFQIIGFGCEIIVGRTLPSVFIAHTPEPRPTRMTKIPTDSFGTRHRSVFRYCDAVSGSIGFIISHDGQVRAVRKVQKNIVLWQDIALSRHLIPVDDSTAKEGRR